MMRCCKWYLVVGLGLGIAATGAIFYLAWRDIFDILVTEEKSLNPGAKAYKEWRRPRVQPVWRFYMYNWTNAASYLQQPGTMLPRFDELGPFTFDEHSEPVDVKHHAGNGTLSYRKRTYFRRSLVDISGGKLQQTNITNVNLAALLISFLSANLDYFVQRELSFMLHDLNQTIETTRPVGQLLFAGYRGPLWDQARKLLCARYQHPGLCDVDRLAYFLTYNITRKASARYSLGTGVDDRAPYGIVRLWNEGTIKDSPCEHFDGYTGEMFPSRFDRRQSFPIVLPELCLRLTLDYDGEQLVNGILGHRFVAKAIEPFNRTDQCIKADYSLRGYSTLASNECVGLPVYRDDTQHNVRSEVQGGDAGMYLIVEPTTGMLLESQTSLKYHTFLTPNAHIGLFQDAPELYIPLYRFIRYYRLGDANTQSLKKMLHLLDAGRQIALAGCALGAVVILLAVSYAYWNAHRTKTKAPQRKLHAEYHIVRAPTSSVGGIVTQ
ncbi:protein peste-like [Anopheles ziemanni]|uniref:protein peste-like n=1 Tax=Anopheles coustani TaxID=139045 RepID=UPI00265927E0|nr:protein peste-like [Anopheles coustani]XP_058175626.1 protein peste-like [Anopheles ziemanni]